MTNPKNKQPSLTPKIKTTYKHPHTFGGNKHKTKSTKKYIT